MPSIGFEGPTIYLPTPRMRDAKEGFLDDNHKQKDTERISSRNRSVGGAIDYFFEAVYGHSDTRTQQQKGSSNAGQGFHFPVTVGVGFVWGTLRVFEREPDHG